MSLETSKEETSTGFDPKQYMLLKSYRQDIPTQRCLRVRY